MTDDEINKCYDAIKYYEKEDYEKRHRYDRDYEEEEQEHHKRDFENWRSLKQQGSEYF